MREDHHSHPARQGLLHFHSKVPWNYTPQGEATREVVVLIVSRFIAEEARAAVQADSSSVTKALSKWLKWVKFALDTLNYNFNIKWPKNLLTPSCTCRVQGLSWVSSRKSLSRSYTQWIRICPLVLTLWETSSLTRMTNWRRPYSLPPRKTTMHYCSTRSITKQ